MSVNEMTNEIKRVIWERQNGMCALTGKKFEIFDDSIEAEFIYIKPEDGTNHENIVMIWKSQDELPNRKLRKYFFPYANFNSYSETDKATEIKEEIDTTVDLSKTTEDWKSIRNQIREITNILQTLGLPLSQRNEFKELLISALDNVNQRQTEKMESERKTWDANFKILTTKTEEAVAFARAAEFFKEGRERLIAVQNEIKDMKISREQRNELDKVLRETFEYLNKKQSEFRENFEMECSENYHQLKTLVANYIKKAAETQTFVSARDMLIHAQSQIKEKTLKREQKDELFKQIRDNFDVLREKFDEVLKVSAEEIEKNYEEVKPIVTEAVEFAKNATSEQAQEAREKLINAQAKIKNYKLKKSYNDELFSAIREVFGTINEISADEREHFEVEANNNFKKMFTKIELVLVDIENAIDFNNSSEILASIRTELQLLKLKKEHRNKLFDKTRHAFDLLSKKRNEYNERKFEEKQQKLNSTIEHLKQKANRLATLLEKDKEILEQQLQKTSENTQDNIVDAIRKRMQERENELKTVEFRVNDINKELEKIHKKEQNRKQDKNSRRKDDNKSEEPKQVVAANDVIAEVPQEAVVAANDVIAEIESLPNNE